MSEIQEKIKQALEEHFVDGVKYGFKEGLERGAKGFVTHNTDIYGKFREVYDMTLDFAIKANSASFEKFNPPSKLANIGILSRSCSYKIGERAVILFRSTFSLCEDGWASVVPILQRSLVECLLNLYLTLKEHNDYWAFRFFSHDFLNNLVAKDSTHEIKEESRTELVKLLSRLNGADLIKAKEYKDNFIKKGEFKIYWYKPDFESARKILPADLYSVYSGYSYSVHSSVVGMDLFKDDTSKVSINPRNDQKSIKMALVGSSRILYEITNIRIQHESLDLKKESRELLKAIVGLKEFM